MKHPCPNAVGVVFGPQLRVCKDLMCGLYSLKFGIELHLSARITVGMVLQSWKIHQFSSPSSSGGERKNSYRAS